MAGRGRTFKMAHDGPLSATWIGCIPRLEDDLRNVMVDLEGNVMSSSLSNSKIDDQEQLFEPNATSVIESTPKSGSL